jgi:hypothetical protein
VIKEVKREVVLSSISIKKVNKCLRKGCRIYAVEAINEDNKHSITMPLIISIKMNLLLSQF